ncbi:hypothetical protein MNV49_002899 [Pseudohyphozyma bogoriensis]|nr:hypothetical protein MNV49_002899 [Pseudohyphozyma bogoriensis]
MSLLSVLLATKFAADQPVVTPSDSGSISSLELDACPNPAFDFDSDDTLSTSSTSLSSLSSLSSKPTTPTQSRESATTRVPPEIWRQILVETFALRTWRAIAREAFWESVEVVRREDMEEVVKRLERGSGRWVRELDASGRKAMNDMPDLVSVDATPVMVEAQEDLRRQRQERERQLLVQILATTPSLTKFDVDLGFNTPLRNNPTMLPTSIRTLTLRNSEPEETFRIVNCLPELRSLTLRLALEWYIPEDSDLSTTCQLDKFELSITGWAETDAQSIHRLLANSKDTLTSLAVRNKCAINASAFLPVARQLIKTYGSNLKHLSIKDVPNHGRRRPTETPLAWFPDLKTVIALPNLQTLHLSGVPHYSAVLTALKCTKLASLTIEDFDTLPSMVLREMLASPSLKKLSELRYAKSGEWEFEEEEREKVEEDCRRRGVRLVPSWELRRFERSWW